MRAEGGTPGAVALIGDPVAQSVSPAMHRAAFAEAGLRLDYISVRMDAGELARAFPGLRRRYFGLNVTRPLKEAIIPLLDEVSPEAAEAGSVNTVSFGGAEGRSRSRGDSTDGAGFLSALRRATDRPISRALVLGTGGAARAVAVALRREGATVEVTGRNGTAGRRLASEVGVRFFLLHPGRPAVVMEGVDLLVNATPVGSWGGENSSPVPDSVPLPAAAVVFDLVYRPRRTMLLERAEAAGCVCVEGIEMLIEQGARSFEIWTGRPAPVEVMRQAAHSALDSEVGAELR